MNKLFEGKTILVTGGCGSIGSEIVRQLLKFNPEAIRVFDCSEDGHFNLNQSLDPAACFDKIRNLIGDVRDKDRVKRAMNGVDIVFHAAALKHVPFTEYNPFEAMYTNVLGTNNLVEAAIEENIDRFIGISTDKAVNPVNTLGATKLLGEKIITGTPLGKSKVRFCSVRFGNVLASSGSVIPIFKKQIKDGQTITITSPQMTRFFMSMEDAVSLVLKAAQMTEGGETFILKMSALKIADLAEVMVEELAGKYGKNPKEFEYKVIGVRPGEKLHESLLAEEELPYTRESDGIYVFMNSLLAQHRLGKIQENGRMQNIEYRSDNMKHLSKEEIKKLLYEKKIL